MCSSPLRVFLYVFSLAFIVPSQASGQDTKVFLELEKQLQERYSLPRDSLRLKAAMYLMAGLPNQWHYDPLVLETTGGRVRVMDINIIDAEYLAENIDYAFRAWELPWAKDLSFEDFCQYLLPYKMGNEAPERWRAAVWEEYSWVLERANEKTSPSEICRWVDASVRQWYTIHLGYNYPSDAGYLKAKEVKEGSCQGASLMILYPLRALGVCAVYDYVPQWGNRSDRHSWDALYEDGRLISFNAPETDPGKHKLEFIGMGRMLRKRPKIFRKDYMSASSIDVTAEYIPISIRRWVKHLGKAEMMIFDNANWRSVCEGSWKGGYAEFKDMARGVAFLPAITDKGMSRALWWPLVIERNGRLKVFRPRLRRHTVRLTAKYPEDKSNAIFPGEHYELFVWKGHWVSLGMQEAKDTVLTYHRVPVGALLWLRNLDKGVQERIFTFEKGRQIWY